MKGKNIKNGSNILIITLTKGGRGGWKVDVVVRKHFMEYTYFSRLVKVIIRILEPFYVFFFH